MKEKMLGKVKWFKDNKGYGYIIGGDDETYFFELINCVNPEEKFAAGDLVKFIPKYLNAEVATGVERIEKENE